MQTMIRMILICFVLLRNEIYGLRRRCINTGVLFTDKILRSPIIVYGEPLSKEIYLETDTELLFNVTFRVDCIFKGQDIEHQIEITAAGIQENRTACQWLDPGKLYVVFLEKYGSKANVYCPLDFQERMVDDITYELLEKTCHLIPTLPLNSTVNNCPNVSMTEYCPNDDVDLKIMPKGKNSDVVHPNVKTTFNNVNSFYLQPNITMARDQSLAGQIADNPNNHASLLSSISVWMMILTIIIKIVLV